MKSGYKSLFLAVFLCGSLICWQGLFAGSLHLIAVGDTLAEDIRDSVLIDLNNIESHASDIAHYSGLTLVKHQLTYEKANADEVLEYVKNLETESDDVIIFYFSGHGFRTSSKEANPWPNLYFSVSYNAADLLDIANVIRLKDAHFSLVMADCCNNMISDRIAPKVSRSRTMPKIDEARIERNIKKLFIETNGQVLASGSGEGQFAYGNSIEGGRFSYSYLLAFNTYTRLSDTEILDWQRLFDGAIFKTKALADLYGHDQTPIYSIQN